MTRPKRTKSASSIGRGEDAGGYACAMLAAAGILTFFLVWQLAAQFGLVSTRYLSRPLELVTLFIVKLHDPRPDGSVIGVNILASLEVSIAGLTAAVVLGLPLGLVMGWYKGVDRFVSPLFEILRPIPPVSWIPLTIVWLGIGIHAKAFIIFFSAFIPCVINSYTGIKQTSQVLIDVAKTCGAGNFTIFRKVGIPSSLPVMFAGIRVALGNAWSTLVAAEMLAANAGLGYMIMMGRNFARPDLILLGMILIGALGASFVGVMAYLERRIIRGGDA
ncbi:MAG: ABC transporter permease [Planctomycetes bacterium]|nr:ABC transporter permease [Planctomycetota bacterium]